MFFRELYAHPLQEHLDETCQLEDTIPDEAIWTEVSPSEEPFAMSGLYELIPGCNIAPLRIGA